MSVTPASLEQNVTAVLTKVAAGDADAGLVYATDVLGNDDVESIVPAGAQDVVNRYPIVSHDGCRGPRDRRGFRAVRAQRRGAGGARGSGLRRAVTRRREVGGFVPQVLAIPAVVGLALLVLPLVALVLRVEWSTLWQDITAPASIAALGLSLETGLSRPDSASSSACRSPWRSRA